LHGDAENGSENLHTVVVTAIKSLRTRGRGMWHVTCLREATNAWKILDIGQNLSIDHNKQIPWLLVRKRTVPTEQPPLVGEI
jgi:hypothetical protein